MDAEHSYGIGYFLNGKYHFLCREGRAYRFHVIEPESGIEPEVLSYGEARNFIEIHPVCRNIASHEIRIMKYSEMVDIIEGRSPASSVKSLALSGEDEEEEPLH